MLFARENDTTIVIITIKYRITVSPPSLVLSPCSIPRRKRMTGPGRFAIGRDAVFIQDFRAEVRAVWPFDGVEAEADGIKRVAVLQVAECSPVQIGRDVKNP